MKLSPTELEAQYNSRNAIPEHVKILPQWERRSERIRSTQSCWLDLPYGRGSREKLDLFTVSKTPSAVHVFIHGGYWQRSDKRLHSFIAESLCTRGINVAVVSYDLCPAVGIDDIVTQVRTALAWLWRNAGDLGIDARRIQVCGHSAGGHLTAMLMATDWPSLGADLPANFIQSGVGISGVFELEPLIHTSINDAVRMDPETARRNSPVLLEPPTRAPLMIAAGELESAEFHRQAQALATAWQKYGVPVSLLQIPATNHFTVLEQLASGGPLLERVVNMLKK